MLTKTDDREETEAILRAHQKSPEEVAQLAAGVPPFLYNEWQQDVPPATPEELADWEEFLRSRDLEREASLARSAVASNSPF